MDRNFLHEKILPPSVTIFGSYFIRVSIWAILFALVLQGKAQGLLPTKGTDFWVAFPYSPEFGAGAGTKRCDLFITADVGTTGTVTVPGQGWSQAFTVTANQTTTVTIPYPTVENTTSEVVENRGVHVVSGTPVSVFAISFQRYSSDATQVFPKPSLGTQYRISSYKGLSSSTPPNVCSQFIIAATEDNTQIRITPTAGTLGGKPANVPFIINLNQGQCYQVIAQNYNLDFTGTIIEGTDTSGSCRPFAVFSGSGCTNIPAGCFACDQIYDQALPTPYWGKNYYAAPYAFATSYTLRILAHQSGTTYSFNGNAPVALNAGQYTELNNVTTASCIQANKPISVIQYMQGVTCSGAGDPSMLYLNSEDQKIDQVTFSTVTSTIITQHDVSVIMKTPFVNQLTLDGAAVPGSSFTNFPFCPSYSYANLSLTQGSHTLAADSGFSAYVYGTGQAESYAYSAGSYSKTPPIVVDSVLCTSSTLTLGKPGQYYNQWWSTASDLTDTIHIGATLTLNPPIIPDLYVLHADELLSGCSKTFYFNVEVPNPPQLSITQSADTVCQYQPVQLNVHTNPVSGLYQYSWTPTAGLDNPNIANPIATPSTSTWYVVGVSTPNLCGGIVYDSVFIYVRNGDLTKFHTTASPATVCAGDSAQLSVTVEKAIFEESFDPGVGAGIWSAVTGGIASTACGSLSANALYFNSAGQRLAATNDLNLLNGGTIRFALKIANGTAPCEDADFGEDVVLEYSTNGGGSWVLVNTYYESLYPNFTSISLPVPPLACTAATRFRWRQLANSGVNQDNWALDDIVIGAVNNTGLNYSWSPAAGLSSTSGVNPKAAPLVSTTYICQATDNTTGCTYTDSVHLNVAPNYTLNTIPDTNLCQLGGIQLYSIPSISGTGYTYHWSPGNALSDTLASSPIASPITTTTYQVTVTSPQGCIKQANTTVHFVSLAGFNATPDLQSICLGDSVHTTLNRNNSCGAFNSSCSGNTDSAAVGFGATSSTAGAITPFYGSNKSSRRQYLFLASELAAGGMTQGCTIKQIEMRVGTNGTAAYQNFSIKMGCTNITDLTTNFETGLSTVFNPKTVNATFGYIGLNFDINYDWDGVSNLLVEVCYDNPGTVTTMGVYYNTQGFLCENYVFGNTPNCNTAMGTTGNLRPNMEFKYCTTASPNLVYSWTPVAGVSNPAIENPLLSPSTTTTYQLTGTDTVSGCIFKDSVHVNVGPPFTITHSPDTILCSASGVPLFASNTSGPGAVYSWSPAGSLSDSTLSNPVANPVNTTTYHVTVTSAQGCSKADSVRVTVLGHSVFDAVADNYVLCPGDTAQADVYKSAACGTNGAVCNGLSDSATLGTNAAVSTAVSISPFTGSYQSNRKQFLFRLSELNAQGMTVGSTIGSLAFNIANVVGTGQFQNFTIKVGCTNLATLTNNFETGLVTVFNPKTILLGSAGWRNFLFDYTYDWDGTSNLIVEVCYSNTVSGSNSGVYYTPTAFGATIYAYGNSVCNNAIGTTTASRPNMRFHYCATPLGNLTYSWTPTLGVSNSTIKNPLLYPSISTTYYVVATDNLSGCVYSDSVPLTVGINSLVANAGNDTSVCNAIGIHLNVTHNAGNLATYSWQPANKLNNATIQSPTITVNGTQQFVVTVTDSAGCAFTRDTVLVTVVPPAAIALSADTFICPGDTAHLSASGAVSYNWAPASSLSNASSANPLAFPSATTNYYLSATDTVGCIINDSVLVSVLQPTAFTIGNDTAICLGQTVVLHATSGYSSYQWQDGSVGINYSASSAGTYWVHATGQCSPAADTMVLSVNMPPLVNLGNDTSVCQGQNIVLDAGNSGNVFNWSPVGNSQTLNVNTSGAYSVTVTNAFNCSAADTAVVTVVANPTINISGNTSVCPGDSVLLTASSAQQLTYQWSPVTGLSQPNNAATYAAPLTPITYSVTGTSQLQCSATASVSISILSLPQVSLGNDTSFCAGETVVFDAGPGFNTYLWQDGSNQQTYTAGNTGLYWVEVSNQCSVDRDTAEVIQLYPLPVVNLGPGGDICMLPVPVLNAGNAGSTYLWSTGETMQQISVTQSAVYIVTVTTSHGCINSGSVAINLLNLPQVYLGADTNLCDGQVVVLNAEFPQATYLWQDGSKESQYTVKQQGLHWVKVYTVCGEASDSINVKYSDCNCRLFVPNAFTANDDGENDLFKVEADCDLRFFELQVYNRWGEKVFESNTINEGWDGTYRGLQQPPGVYVYLLSYVANEAGYIHTNRLKGSITLIR